jgi:hypothetical protein
MYNLLCWLSVNEPCNLYMVPSRHTKRSKSLRRATISVVWNISGEQVLTIKANYNLLVTTHVPLIGSNDKRHLFQELEPAFFFHTRLIHYITKYISRQQKCIWILFSQQKIWIYLTFIISYDIFWFVKTLSGTRLVFINLYFFASTLHWPMFIYCNTEF